MAAVAGGVAAGVAGAVVVAALARPVLKGIAEALHDELHDESISKKKIPVHCDLAASYGGLMDSNMRELDEHLKVIISGTNRAIAQLEDYRWDSIVACLMQNTLLKHMRDDDISRAEKMDYTGFNFFKFDGSPDEKVVQEVYDWFRNKLIRDEDVFDDTRIDIDAMGKIVGETGAAVDNLLALLYKEEYEEKEVVDVGILRYPDFRCPYFKIYRIQLLAWRECDRILVGQKDKSGIVGRYNCCKFEARESVIAALSKETRYKACCEAEHLFDPEWEYTR